MERLIVGFVGPIKPVVQLMHCQPFVMTFEEAMRRSIFYSDERRWRHRMLNRLLRRLVD